MIDPVQHLLTLPERDPLAMGERLADLLTPALRLQGSSWALKPLQALALAEACVVGGLFAPLPVGEGKTLIIYLLPLVLRCKRPLLLLPHALIEDKTEHDFGVLSKEWRSPEIPYTIRSFELVSARPGLLTELDPDVVVLDEAHKAKNLDAKITRRLMRHAIDRRPKCFYFTGTPEKSSLKDWWHLQLTALPPALRPLPGNQRQLEHWCERLDPRSRPPYIGPLKRLCGKPKPRLIDLREAFGKRLARTPGIIIQERVPDLPPLGIEVLNKRHDKVDEVTQHLRSTYSTPSGETFVDITRLWAHCRSAARGYWYRWKDPPPSSEWVAARRAFSIFYQTVRALNKDLETERQVMAEYDYVPAVQDWARLRSTYKIVTEPVWFTDDIMQDAYRWAVDHQGVVWADNIAEGERLQELGLPYFHHHGRNVDGVHIMNYKGPAVVASSACSEGVDLTQYTEALILDAPPSAAVWEQRLARLHRGGQKRPVRFEVWAYVKEQRLSLRKALEESQDLSAKFCATHKIRLADITYKDNDNG